MDLRAISPMEYARLVLPLSAKLWAGRRNLDTYVTQTLEIAQSGYGRRYYRTLGLYDDDGALTSSCKRYERTVRLGARRLRVCGVGAVFTPEPLRGRGYATAMLGMLLDAARADGYDAVYLFSDIRPRFYEELGFRLQPSRVVTLRADDLAAGRVQIARLEERDWDGIRRCFSMLDRTRAWSFTRTPLVWEWIRMRLRHGSEHTRGADAHFVVRNGRGAFAYAFGMRIPERDTYALDEFGFAGNGADALVPALLRGAAGDLRRISGWLPPDGARRLLPRSLLRERRNAIFMIAPLSELGKRWCALSERPSPADGVWSTDHV
ncbi:MAG TPA: GNAT family N-acetyltransferase [Candidatus Tyrphobacter sp.]